MTIGKKAALVLGLAGFLVLTAWLLRQLWLPFFAADARPLIGARFAAGGAWLDRHGKPLRLFADDQGDFFCYTPLASHSRHIIDALLTAEDRSFYSHPGFNPAAIARAAWQNVRNNRIISGASTISQQLMRILSPRQRTFAAKIDETLAAMLLECRFSKAEILEFYLNAVPMFGNVRGFHLASLLLFKKTPDLLNLAESATLAAVVQSPGRLSPFSRSGNHRLRKRRDWIIREMLRLGFCNLEQAENALKVNIPEFRSQMPFKAPHFCDLLTQKNGPPKGNIATTISLPLQNMLYENLRAHLPRLAKRGARQAGAMLVDAATMEVLAMVGSAEFGPVAGGYNNVCVSRRSGGSILKPFLYALALEKGFYPSFVIADTMQPFKTPQGEYLPYNADRRDYGPVTVRTALGNSLNIAAVKMLNLVGIRDFFSFLVDLELLQAVDQAAEFYGLGLAIGNPELRMLDIIRAYGVFANAGRLKNLSFILNEKVIEKELLSPAVAYLIYDILSDPAARLLTFGTPAFFKFKTRWALKTGTSTNYRDSWLVAFNNRYLLAIWVGNFDGSPTRNLSGAGACGPIAKNIIDYLDAGGFYGEVTVPAGINRVKVCSVSGQRPGHHCRLVGYDLMNGSENDLPWCSFHQSDNAAHELPADYARWIRDRSRSNDADPFRLTGNVQPHDSWMLPGVEKPVPAVVATGQILVEDSFVEAAWNNIKIVSPHQGDRYILAPTAENFIHLRAIPEKPVAEIVWLINGREFIRTPPPYEAYWPMHEGQFKITAIGAGEAAAQVEIMVER